jgi:hypothetical protein
MVTRISLRNRTSSDLGIRTSGGLADLFDNQLKLAFRITDAEYDWIATRATDEELDALLIDPSLQPVTFAEKRKMLTVLQKYLNEFNKSNS